MSAARVRRPVRRAEAGERRDEVHAVGRVDRPRERLALGGVGEQAEPVAQPLHRCARDEDRSFERVRRDRCPRRPCARARAAAASSRRRCRRARTRRCRTSPSRRRARRATPAGRRRARRPAASRRGTSPRRTTSADGCTSGSSARGTAKSSSSSSLQSSVVEVEQHRARRVRHVGRVHRAAGQLPEQPRVDRAEREPAPRAPRLARGSTRASSRRSTDRASGRCARGSRRPAARGTARRCAGPATRSRGCTGSPVARSQTIVVSRWFAIPIASSVGGATPASVERGLGRAPDARPELLRILLDPARPRRRDARRAHSRGPRPRARRRRRGTSCRSFPGRRRGSHRASSMETTRRVPGYAPARSSSLAIGGAR